MAPIVAPGICRFSILQTYGDRQVVNVLDMQIDTTGGTASRSDACFDVAGDILNNWDDHILALQVNELVAQEVRWVDLDSLNGSTGGRSSTSANTWPKGGGNASDDGLPSNVALLVAKQAPGGGRSARNGRWYISGVPETFTSEAFPNIIDGTFLTLYNDGLSDFLDGVNDQGAGSIQRQMVVVHTRNEGTPTAPDIEYQGNDEVTALLAQPLLATQRRRLRG